MMKYFSIFVLLAFALSVDGQTPDENPLEKQYKLERINPNLVFRNKGGGVLVSEGFVPCEVLLVKDSIAFADIQPTGEGWPVRIAYFINEKRAEITMDSLVGDPPCMTIQKAEAPTLSKKKKKKASKDVEAPPPTQGDFRKWKGKKCEVRNIKG